MSQSQNVSLVYYFHNTDHIQIFHYVHIVHQAEHVEALTCLAGFTQGSNPDFSFVNDG